MPCMRAGKRVSTCGMCVSTCSTALLFMCRVTVCATCRGRAIRAMEHPGSRQHGPRSAEPASLLKIPTAAKTHARTLRAHAVVEGSQ